MLIFDWDDANLGHIALHRVAPTAIEYALRHGTLLLQRTLRNGEERYVQLGEAETGRVLVIVVTFRDGRIRVVTAFPAPQKLQRFYRS